MQENYSRTRPAVRRVTITKGGYTGAQRKVRAVGDLARCCARGDHGPEFERIRRHALSPL